MADAALKTEAPAGAENFKPNPRTAEAALPVGRTEANIAGTLVKLGGEKTPDPDKSLLSIMTAGGGESTLAGEDSLKQENENKTTNVTDLKTGKQMTQEDGLQRARQGESDNPQTIDKAANDNEKLDPNAETKEQKMQRLSQELSDNRKKYVESTRWFGSSTASGEINKDDSERAYKESLKSYREAKMADVQEQIASDPSLKEKPEGSDKTGADKLIEDTLREFTIGEFKNLQEDDAEIRLQKRKENLGEWGANAIDKVKDMLESYRKMKAWKKIGLSVTANILTGGSASIVLRGLGIAASSSAYKEMMEGKAESMRDARWENVNQEGLGEAKTENGLDIDKVKDFLNNQSDNMADKFQSYKKMRFARTVGSIGAAVGISVGGSYAFRELMQTDTAQMVKEKAVDVAQNVKSEFMDMSAIASEPGPGEAVLPPEPAGEVSGSDAAKAIAKRLEEYDSGGRTLDPLPKPEGNDLTDYVPGKGTEALPDGANVSSSADKMNLSEKTGDIWGEKLPGAESEIGVKVGEDIKSSIPDIKAESPVDSGTVTASEKIDKLTDLRGKMQTQLDNARELRAKLDVHAAGSTEHARAIDLEKQAVATLAKVDADIAALEPKIASADIAQTKGVFAAGEGGVMTDGETAPPAAETYAGKTYDVQKGDNIWKIVDKQIGDRGLNEGQKTYAIDEIKDRLGKMSAADLKAIGISSGDINNLSTEDNIDLGKIMGNSGENIKSAVEDASKLSADQVASIEQNNDKISDFFGRNKGVEMTSENIDKVLQGKGDTLITPDDATSAAEDAVKKAGEKIGNIADLEQKAKDVLGQYGQRRAGESDSAYLNRVNFAARQMGVDLYSSAPKADVSAVIPDARSSGSGSSATESPRAEGGVDWSKPPEGYEPRVQPPAETTPPPAGEAPRTYQASYDKGPEPTGTHTTDLDPNFDATKSPSAGAQSAELLINRMGMKEFAHDIKTTNGVITEINGQRVPDSLRTTEELAKLRGGGLPKPQSPVYTAAAGRATNYEGYGVKIANDGQGNIRTEGSDWSAYQRADGSSGFRDESITSSRDAAGNVKIDTNRDAAEAFARVSRPEDAYNALSGEPRGGKDELKIPGMKTDKEIRAEERAAKRAAKAWRRFIYDAAIKDNVKGSKILERIGRTFRG